MSGKRRVFVGALAQWAALGLAFFLFSTTAAGARPRKTHRVVGFEQDELAPHLSRSTWTVQDGASALNRFRVVRIRSASGGGCGAAPLLLISPFGFPVEFWQIPNGTDPASGFAAQIALSRGEVWLLDSRRIQAAAGSCESGALDCSPMKDWGVDAGVSDALYARQLMRRSGIRRPPVIGGFSGGSSTALAAVNRRPHAFSGVFLWEGTLLTTDPTEQQRHQQFCEADLAAIDAGTYYDASVQGFSTLFDLATDAPQDPTPLPSFPPMTTNLGALLFALSQPNAENPLNFTETFIRFAGDPVTETLTWSALDRVLQLGPLVGSYAPVAFIRDTHCSLAGIDGQFVERLDRFGGDALVFAEGRGFGPLMLETADALINADVTVSEKPHLGESDRYFHANWQEEALAPLLTWLQER